MPKLFKSYYVVWKQEGTSIRLKLGVWFKSYYVVWKPKYNKNKLKYNESLNRTMQYGNKDVIVFGAATATV